MNFIQLSGSTIQQAFEEFHKSNPLVYTHFKRLAFKAINSGKKKISSKLICNVIRWEVYLNTQEPTLFDIEGVATPFKINDAYTAHYARLFMDEYPEHSDKFETRKLR